MQTVIRSILAVVTLLVAFAGTVRAQALVQNAVPDETARTLTIKGSGFVVVPPPEVYLGFTPLTLVSVAPTVIVAELPPVAAIGGYVLFVVQGAETAVFSVSLGAIGRVTAPPQGVGTPAAPFSSEPLLMSASTYSTWTQTEERQTFRWRVDPVANNTEDPGGRLRLSFAAGGAAQTSTGLAIQKTGVIQFAPDQTFPGGVATLAGGSGVTVSASGGSTTASISTGGIASAMIANGTISSADILNGQVGEADLDFNPATQLELMAHDHDASYGRQDEFDARFHPVYTQLAYAQRVVQDVPSAYTIPGPTIGTFRKTRVDSRILLLWNGSVRSERNSCGYQLRIDGAPAPGNAGQGYAFLKETSSPLSVSASFNSLSAGEHTVSIWMRGSGGGWGDATDLCEINPARIPETIIVVESGR